MMSFVIGSCSLMGPQSDKVVKMVVEVDKEVILVEDIQLILEKLTKRLEKVSKNPKVSRNENSNQINVEVATHYDAERIKQYVLNPGDLGFYETYSKEKIYDVLMNSDAMINEGEEEESNLLVRLKKDEGYGAILFSAPKEDTLKVRAYINLKMAESSLPVDKSRMRFLWGKKEQGNDDFPLYAIKLNADGKPVLSGEVIDEAILAFNQINAPVISMQMNEVGAKIWERLTGKAFENQSHIAIVLNDEVYSAPGVSSGPIIGGSSQISGNFTVEEVQDLANILTVGAIPLLRLVDFEVQNLQ